MGHVFILKEAVLAIHEMQLVEHGGGDGVRDEGLLDSALSRAENLVNYGDPPPDLAALAAAYAFGIARNHPFIDGNKRTSLVVAETFLVLNGADLKAENVETVLTWLALSAGEMDEVELSAWIRERL